MERRRLSSRTSIIETMEQKYGKHVSYLWEKPEIMGKWKAPEVAHSAGYPCIKCCPEQVYSDCFQKISAGTQAS